MDRWLGDGGMAIIGAIGGAFEHYGVDGEDLGWVRASFTPTQLACNPHGAVQAGVHSVILDAAMNFSINAALVGRDRTEATIEMTTELMRPALLDGPLRDARGRRATDAPDRLRRGDDRRVTRAS